MEENLTRAQHDALGDLRSSRGSCPAAATLVAYEALSAGDRARHPVHNHVTICSRCQLVLLHAAETTKPASSPIRWALPLAALLVLGVAMTMVLSRNGGSPVTPPETVRGSEIQASAPAGSIDTLTEFAWQSPIRADRYRITVSRGSEQVWRAETTATRIDAPAGVFAENVEYRWMVEAIDREGDVRMTSPPQSFTYARRK